MVRAALLVTVAACVLNAQPVFSTRVESLSISNVTVDHVELQLTVAISTSTHVALQSATFEKMRFNGIPVHVARLRSKLELDGKRPRSVVLGPIVIYYRDLEVLDPVRRMVAEQSASLDGLARLRVDMGLGSPVQVLAPLHQKSPVILPGGVPARRTADAALAAADTAIRLGEKTVDQVKKHLGWTDDLIDKYKPALLRVETRYGGGRVVRGMGFRIRADRFITTAELLKPWLYDPEPGAVDASAYDVRVFPGGFGIKNGQLRIGDVDSGTEKVFVSIDGKLRSVEVARRDSDHNIALVDLAQPSTKAVVHPVTTARTEWDDVALYRPRAGSFDIIYVRARKNGGRIQLLDPTDPSTFGSPLVAPEGAIGIVQDESSAALIGSQN